MFGTTPDERAYERAAEWITIVERAYAADEPFDFDGAYYKLKGVVSKPASLQRPRPVTMNAAFGGPGRDFAARHCDFLFSTFTDIADGRKHLADISARAAAAGRDVRRLHRRRMSSAGRRRRRRRTPTTATPCARRTTAAVDNHMAGKKRSRTRMTSAPTATTASASPAAPAPIRSSARRSRSPATIAEIAAEGWAGAALSLPELHRRAAVLHRAGVPAAARGRAARPTCAMFDPCQSAPLKARLTAGEPVGLTWFSLGSVAADRVGARRRRGGGGDRHAARALRPPRAGGGDGGGAAGRARPRARRGRQRQRHRARRSMRRGGRSSSR